MFSKVGKICQRRLYTWLSSRCGIPVLVVGALVAVISLLQFGGVSDGVWLGHTPFLLDTPTTLSPGVSRVVKRKIYCSV